MLAVGKERVHLLEKWFHLRARGTTVGREALAGLTTFVTMAYIVVVCPAVLSQTGMSFDGVFIATVIATVVATLFMGAAANYPIAIAPGLALIAYFTFGVVIGGKIPWQTALGAVFIASAIFLLLSFTKFRHVLIDAIPPSLKHGISAGIGLFITFIGLQNARIIVDSPATLVALGDLRDPATLLAVFGVAVTLALMLHEVRGAIFLGMLLTFGAACALGMIDAPEQLFVLPQGFSETALQLDLKGVFDQGLYAVVFTFFLITLFDTTGTMLGVAEQAGLMQDGKFPNVQTALLADAIGSTVGAICGTSPTSAYVESGAGVAAGGRTGLTAVVVALLFSVTLFCAPLAKMLSQVSAVTAPAMIIVGFFMMDGLRKIDWTDLEEAFPAFLVMLLMPLSYSIATAVGVGFILYPLFKLLRGKGREVHPLLYVFQILFFIQIGFLSH